jgi:3-dehydroquinate synthase
MADALTITRQRVDSSEIRFGGPGWADLTQWIGQHSEALWLVYDRQVESLARTIGLELEAAGVRVLASHGVAVSESTKAVESLPVLYSKMVADGVTRDVVMLAIGGGVLTDWAGYAAASFLRGIRWIAVPTTLLAQVDAAIGGKVAVNLPEGKNLVGAFHLPDLVYINPYGLESLPDEGWRTGLGEVVKSALIAGGPLWERLGEELPPIGRMNEAWRWIIETTARIKIDVVNRDVEEHGDRIYLNFGHTLAHAIEQMAGYGRWTHGQAVAVGSLFALYLSERQVALDPAIRRTVTGWLEQWGLPTSMPRLKWEELQPVLLRDKKARVGGLKWVLLQEPGHPIVSAVPQSVLEAGLDMLSGDTSPAQS